MKKNININILVSCLYIFLIPTKALFHIYVFYVAAIAVSILYIIYILKNKTKITKFEKSFFIFIIISFFGVFYTPSKNSAPYIVKILLMHFISSVSALKLLYYSYNNNLEKTITTAMNIFIKATIIICIICIIVEGVGNVRLGTTVFDGKGTYIELSYNINISIYFIIFKVIFNKKNKRQNYIELFLMAIFTGLSGTRKVLIGILLFIIVISALKNKENLYKLIKVSLIGSISLAIIMFSIMKVDFLYNNIGYRIKSLINYTKGVSMDESSAERKQMRNLAINLFKENKFGGIGTDGFRHYYEINSGKNLYSHCNFTEILCNNGIIGFIAYYLFHFYIIINNIKKIKYRDKYTFFMISIIIVCLVQDYGTVSYYPIQFIFLYMMISVIDKFNIKNEVELENEKNIN